MVRGQGKAGKGCPTLLHRAQQSTEHNTEAEAELSGLQWTPATSRKGSLSAQHLTDRQQEQAQSSADTLPSHSNDSTSIRAQLKEEDGTGAEEQHSAGGSPCISGSPPMVFVLWLQ